MADIRHIEHVGNNRLLIQYADGREAYRLHETDVVTRHPNGSVVIDDGGWKTCTTSKAINQGLQYFGVEKREAIDERAP